MHGIPNSLVSTCIEQLKLTLESMVGLGCEIDGISRPPLDGEGCEIYSAMNLDGDLPGCIMVGLGRSLATSIVSEMLMAAPDEIQDDLLDGIGELLNIIVGNTKTSLQQSGIHILLRTPINETGAPPKSLENDLAPGVVVRGVVSGQPLLLWIWLPGVDENLPQDTQ